MTFSLTQCWAVLRPVPQSLCEATSSPGRGRRRACPLPDPGLGEAVLAARATAQPAEQLKPKDTSRHSGVQAGWVGE